MSMLKEVKQQEEIQKKRHKIRIATWVITGIILVLIWYFAK